MIKDLSVYQQELHRFAFEWASQVHKTATAVQHADVENMFFLPNRVHLKRFALEHGGNLFMDLYFEAARHAKACFLEMDFEPTLVREMLGNFITVFPHDLFKQPVTYALEQGGEKLRKPQKEWEEDYHLWWGRGNQPDNRPKILMMNNGVIAKEDWVKAMEHYFQQLHLHLQRSHQTMNPHFEETLSKEDFSHPSLDVAPLTVERVHVTSAPEQTTALGARGRNAPK